jgi:hypothetical protein
MAFGKRYHVERVIVVYRMPWRHRNYAQNKTSQCYWLFNHVVFFEVMLFYILLPHHAIHATIVACTFV